MWSAEHLLLIAAVFVLAGFVKGVVGLGLPTISLALMAALLGLKDAIALMLIPAIATNVWQGLAGPHLKSILGRLWLFLLCVCVGAWGGAGILATAEAAGLMALLGGVLIVYAGSSLIMFQVPPPGRFEPVLNPLVGAVSGVMTGMTGSFVVPGSLYLQALNMPRDMLIQTLGVSFTTVSVALLAALGDRGLMTADITAVYALAVIPSFIGMMLGTRLRRRIPEGQFRKTFFLALLAMGLYIAGRAVL